MDSNHTVGSPSKYSSRQLFPGGRSFSLVKALLEGSEICNDSLLPFTGELAKPKPLPPILTLQLDNACGDNKIRYVFAFCTLFVHRQVFREVFINFLIFGHTDEDIDGLFWVLEC